MPGVFRPMNLTDVLTSLSQQATDQGSQDQVNGLAGFAEVSEASTVSGSMTCTHSTPPGWGQTVWGSFLWG